MKKNADVLWFYYVDCSKSRKLISNQLFSSHLRITQFIVRILFKWGHYMSEDSIKISNFIMRILFESGLYSNADSICDFTVAIVHLSNGTNSRNEKQTLLICKTRHLYLTRNASEYAQKINNGSVFCRQRFFPWKIMWKILCYQNAICNILT